MLGTREGVQADFKREFHNERNNQQEIANNYDQGKYFDWSHFGVENIRLSSKIAQVRLIIEAIIYRYCKIDYKFSSSAHKTFVCWVKVIINEDIK